MLACLKKWLSVIFFITCFLLTLTTCFDYTMAQPPDHAGGGGGPPPHSGGGGGPPPGVTPGGSVPEPSTLMLLGAGAAALYLTRKKNNK